MASAKWLTGNGSWYLGANWSSGAAPDSTPASIDAVTIDAPGSYTVKVGNTVPTSIGSVTLNAAGATLGVSLQGLAVNTAVNLNSGRLLLQGTLKGGSLVMNGGVVMRNSAAALDGVRVQGTLDLARPYHYGVLTLSNYGQLTLLDGTTFVAADGTSPGLLRVGGSAVTFGNSALFDNASIDFAAGYSTAGSLNLGATGSAVSETVTLGKGAIVDVASTVSVTLGGYGTLVNGGAITVEGTLTVGPQATIAQATQPGTLTLQSGGMLVFAAPTVFGGAITFKDATAQVVFQGSGAVGATLQDFQSGDSVDLQGLAYGAGLALSLAGSTVQINQGGVSVGNFELTERPAAYSNDQFSLTADSSGGTLLNTTHRLNLTAPGLPVIAGVSPDTGVSSSDGVTNTGAVTVSGTAEAGSQVALFDAATQIGTATASTLGAWSITPATALSQGGHSLTTRATDAAGNQSRASAAFAVTVDLTAPGLPVIAGVSPDTGLSSSDGVTNTGAVTVSGTAEAGSQVALFDGAAQIGTATASTLGAWSIMPAMALSQGGHSLTTRATDAAGNQSRASAAFAVTVDLTAPGLPVIAGVSPDTGLSSSDGVTNTGAVTVSGTAEAGSQVALFDGAAQIGTATASTLGAWSIMPATALSQGGHSLTTRATDAAGNQSGASAAFAVTVNLVTPDAANFLLTDVTTGASSSAVGNAYTGPVAGLQFQYITVTTDNLNIASATPNSFIHTGSGNDAIDVSRVNGNNVLDGSTGSNFLVGGAGNDTFFVDDRTAAADIWSTVVNFHSGDATTIFGVTPTGFAFGWEDNQGALGSTGLTLHATAPGKPIASVTLAGYSKADLSNGRLSVLFSDNSGTAGNYMYIHGN